MVMHERRCEIVFVLFLHDSMKLWIIVFQLAKMSFRENGIIHIPKDFIGL